MSTETNPIQGSTGRLSLWLLEEAREDETACGGDSASCEDAIADCGAASLASVSTSPSFPGFSLFGCPDVTIREVLEETVSERLTRAKAMIGAGELRRAGRTLDSVLRDFRSYSLAHPDEATTPRMARLFAETLLHQGHLRDRRDEGDAHQSAVPLYENALRGVNAGIDQDPGDAESLLVRAEIHHHLADYGKAMADFRAAARIDNRLQAAVGDYHRRLEGLRGSFAAQREEAQEVQDTPRVILLLAEEIKATEALRDAERAGGPNPFNPDLGSGRADVNARWRDYQRQIEELSVFLSRASVRQAVENILAPLREMAAQGYLTRENLSEYLVRGWIAFSRGPSGRADIHPTEAFRDLAGPEQARVLEAIQRIGVRAQLHDALDRETDADKRLYYRGKIHLLEGNIPAARLALMDFKARTEGNRDPEIQVMREEARGILRHFSLAAIARLLEAAASLSGQRTISWVPLERDFSSRLGPVTVRLLQALRTFIEEGRADTLDEAVAHLEPERRRLWTEFYRNPVVRRGWIVTLPDQKLGRGSPEREAETKAARVFLAAFRDDPGAVHPGVLSVRLEGGALVVPGRNVRNNREAVRVVVGREGGTIRIEGAGSRIWVFPPSDRERVAVVHGKFVSAPNLAFGRDFYESNQYAHRDAGHIAGDAAAGHPNSLDELAETMGGLGTQRNVLAFDYDFERLIESEMRVGLERMGTSGARERELLALAESLRHRSGSYALAGEILEGLFASEIERAMAEIPDADVQRVRSEIEADRGTVLREVQETLAGFAADHPDEFRSQFPSGTPSHDQFERMVTDAMNLKAEIRMRKLAMHRIDARYESGALDRDSIAGRAWRIYDDMKDPLDKPWNLADETWDAIAGEIVVSAITMPLTMGAGTAVRVGLGGTSLALRLAARGGWRYLAARGLIFTGGSVAEGLLMEGTACALYGTPFEMGNVGWNILLSGTYHGVERAWGRIARRTVLSERAIRNATGLSRWARKAGYFWTAMAGQTAAAATMDEIGLLMRGHESPYTFWERLGGHALRMAAPRYGTAAVNVVTGKLAIRAERHSQIRLRQAREGSRGGAGSGEGPRPIPADPAPEWMLRELRSGEPIRAGEEWGTVVGVEGNLVRYEVVGDARRGRVMKTVERTDALLADNVAELPLVALRPTENGLSEYRLANAEKYLDEPIRVFRHVNPGTGAILYYALDGHHRLKAAADQGLENIRVRFVNYDEVSVNVKMENARSDGFSVPVRIADLEVNPARLDDYRGGNPEGRPFLEYRRTVREAGLDPRNLPDDRLQEAASWLGAEIAPGSVPSDPDARRLIEHLGARGWSRQDLASLLGGERWARLASDAPESPAGARASDRETFESEKATRVIPIEGRHWRSFFRKKAWNYGIPVLEGDRIAIYRAPPVSDPVPMPPQSIRLFDGLKKRLGDIGGPRRMRVRVEELRRIYQASPAEIRAKIERVVEGLNTDALSGRFEQRLAYIRERLNKAIANYGQRVAEAPIGLDVRIGTVRDAEVSGAWRHYTDRRGFEAIFRSQRLRPNAAVEGRGPRLWVTDRVFNRAEVQDQIYQNGAIRSGDEGKGDYVVVFRMGQGAEATFNPGKNPIEFWTDRAVEFGAVDVLYAGENTRIVETGP